MDSIGKRVWLTLREAVVTHHQIPGKSGEVHQLLARDAGVSTTTTRDWATYRSLPTPEALSKLAALYLYTRREIEAIATQLLEPKPLTAGSPEVTQIALEAARLFGERAEGMKGRVVIDLIQYLWPKAPQSVEEALGMLYMGFPEYTLRAAPAPDEACVGSDQPSASNAAG